MRAFARYRALLREHQELKGEVRALDKKIDQVFHFLLQKMDALQVQKNEPRKPIGFKTQQKN